jgi:hypothetical protein
VFVTDFIWGRLPLSTILQRPWPGIMRVMANLVRLRTLNNSLYRRLGQLKLGCEDRESLIGYIQNSLGDLGVVDCLGCGVLLAYNVTSLYCSCAGKYCRNQRAIDCSRTPICFPCVACWLRKICLHTSDNE